MQPELLHILILFVAGLFAGAINVMAGGGSTLTLPVLLFLGLDAGEANGTNRVAITVQNVSANASFWRDGAMRFRESLTYAMWTLPGAVIGAFAALNISDAWFERILGVLMIGIVASMLVPRGDMEPRPGKRRLRWMQVSLFGIGFYGGFIQMGVGFLFMATFYHLARMNLVHVTVHKVAVILVYTVPTLLIFALTGHVDWLLGAALASGNASGALVAARLAVRRGEKIIRRVLVVAVLIMAAKVLGLF